MSQAEAPRSEDLGVHSNQLEQLAEIPELPTPAPSRLRRALIALDASALALAWFLVLVLSPVGYRAPAETALLEVAIVGLGLWLVSFLGLHLARVSMIRSVEIAKIARVALFTGLGALLIARIGRSQVRVVEAIAGMIVAFVFLVVARGGFRAHLTHARRHGRNTRSLVLVGASDEAAKLLDLFETHPEAGFRVAAVVGDRAEALASGLAAHWQGPVSSTLDVVDRLKANGVVLVAGSVSPDEMNPLIRRLQDRGVHVHLTNGLHGIDFRRVHSLPIAYEPMFYLEAPSLAQRQYLLKRALDVAGSLAGLLLTSPVFVLVWLAVKLDDRGPLFFRQVRVGQNGQPFTCFKFRTMVVDAEDRLRELRAANERTGPLFKMARDPRITRVGHILRDTSLDELPQLINVLRGEMSLVGPRPALPSEVAEFPPALRDRLKVRPGVTGLWQVEARDNPSFDAYRRLDLYYVDNWSVSLDLVILLATAEHVIARVFTTLLDRRAARREPAEVSTGEQTIEAAS